MGTGVLVEVKTGPSRNSPRDGQTPFRYGRTITSFSARTEGGPNRKGEKERQIQKGVGSLGVDKWSGDKKYGKDGTRRVSPYGESSGRESNRVSEFDFQPSGSLPKDTSLPETVTRP